MRTLTRRQTAQLLGCGTRRVSQLAQTGALPCIRDEHGHRSYRPADVRTVLIRREHKRGVIWTAGRTVIGEHEVYAVEHIARRPGGDLDVVVSATPLDHRARAYLAFRRTEGVWRPLVGRTQDLESAIQLAERELRYAGWDSPELAAVLATVEGE